jgi:putative DNA methylase
MTWDFVRESPKQFNGNFLGQVEYLTRVVERTLPAQPFGSAQQHDASNQDYQQTKLYPPILLTNDNIGYADLSDFFYVWLRRSLKPVFPRPLHNAHRAKAEN